MDRLLSVTDRSIRPELEVSEQKFARYEAFRESGDADVEALASLQDATQKYATPVIEDLYRHFLSFDEIRAFFHDPATLERVN